MQKDRIKGWQVCFLHVLWCSLFSSTAIAADFSGLVISILDGDTIEVLHNTHPERVRLSGIDDPAKVLHSLRHGGITKLHAAGAPHNVVQVLAGHAAQGIHDQVYTHRDLLPLRLLKDGLALLQYPDVKALTDSPARTLAKGV